MSMQHLLLATSLVVCALLVCSTERTLAAPNGRVLEGNPSNIVKYPSIVSVRRKFCEDCAFEHYCGGVIYSANVILTGSNCVRDALPSQLQVVVGTNYRTAAAMDGAIYTVKRYSYPHNPIIDLVKLHMEIELQFDGLRVQSIELAKVRPAAGVLAKVVGWGQQAEEDGLSDSLREVRVPIVSLATCRQRYWWTFIRGNELCAGSMNGGADACWGDAGSPLIVNDELVGLVSWGYGCGRPNYPGVYTDIVHFRNWIMSNNTVTEDDKLGSAVFL